MKPAAFKFAVAFLFFGFIIACNDANEYSTKIIFHLNLSAPVTSLDPAFASDQPNSWAVNQLFNGLVQLNTDLDVVSCIAKNWLISENELVYTFQLRNDVFFHDNVCFTTGKGRKVKASDFVYSFNRLIDPATAARGNWVLQNIVDTLQPFYAKDDTTLIIKLRKPFAPFLQRLCMPYCSVVPEEAITYYGKDFRSNPVGSGPFVFVKWNESDLLLLHKNSRYFETTESGEKMPFLDAVNFQFISNKSTEFLKFINGDLDFVSDIDAGLQNSILTRDGRLQDKYNNKIILLKAPYLNVEYLTILMEDTKETGLNPLSEIKVRQAINYGINRQEMLLFLRNNRGIPAQDGMVPPSLYIQPFYSTIGYDYNPAKASALLKEAGFENGIGLPEIVLHTTDQYQDIAIYIKDKLENIGIALRVETVDPRILREMRVNKQTAFFRSSWIADYGDAESYLQLFYGKSGAPPNYARYQNPVYDSLFENAVAETDILKRDQLYRSMDSLLMQDAPIVPLYYDEIYRFTQPGITNLEPDALNMLQLKRVKKKLQ